MKRMNGLLIGLFGVAAVGLAGQVAAQGKGPRASVDSVTRCELSDYDRALRVTTTLTNKSSGNTVPEVRNGSMIQGTYKDGNARGNSFEILATEDVYPVPQDVYPTLSLSAEFSLCKGQYVRDEVTGSRELNGRSTMNYGISGADGETRNVTNQCSADENGLGGGIKVADVIYRIQAGCALNPAY